MYSYSLLENFSFFDDLTFLAIGSVLEYNLFLKWMTLMETCIIKISTRTIKVYSYLSVSAYSR